MEHPLESEPKDLKVVLQEPILVHSKEITPERKLYLTLLDRQAPLFIYSLYFYNKDESKGTENIFAELKHAMERNLVAYYPPTTNLRGSSTRFLQVQKLHCDLFAAGDPMWMRRIWGSWIGRGPGAVVVIGFGSRHELFDGLSALQLLSDWASFPRGVSLEEIQPPCHERELLRPKVSNQTETSELDKLFAERFQGIPMVRRSSIHIESLETGPKHVVKALRISQEMIKSLRESS